MSKHTKGAWVAVRTVAPKGWNIEALDGAYTVAIARDGTGLPQNEANARLIASAPELLEALIAANAELEMWRAGFPNHSDSEEVAVMIDEAILKATGQ